MADKNFKIALKEAIQKNQFMDFIHEEGNNFTKDELISLLKELYFSVESMAENNNLDFNEFRVIFLENLKKFTVLYDEE